MQINALYGFLSMLLKVIEDRQPSHLAVAFDVKGKTFRDELFDAYKATRTKADDALYAQIPLIHEAVRAIGIPVYTKEGYEADDVIGTIAATVRDIPVTIVSGDRDLLQLVDDNTTVHLLKKGISTFVDYDIAGVHDYYGFGPEQVVMYKAICGDSSDNIPGIKGIGDKGAKKLIEYASSIDDLYVLAHDEQSILSTQETANSRKKILEGESQARLSLQLATIACDVPDLVWNTDEALCDHINYDAWRELAQKYQFKSLLKRLPASEQEQAPVVEIKEQQGTLADMQQASSSELICYGIFEQVDVRGERLTAVYVWTSDQDVLMVPFSSEHDEKEFFEFIKKSEVSFVSYQTKSFVLAALRLGVVLETSHWQDIELMAYVHDSSQRSFALPDLIERYADGFVIAEAQASLFAEDATHAQYAVGLAKVYRAVKKSFEEEQTYSVYTEMEAPLIGVLARMEWNGVLLDREQLQALDHEMSALVREDEQAIWDMAGEEFNVASSVQLRTVLFETLELPTKGIKKGKTGYSTAASELEKLRPFHDVIGHIERFRELTKLQNTYIQVLPSLVHPETKRIHTSFNQAVAATGRLSSSQPNLQNIPVRTEQGKQIREAFIAAPGYQFVAADYSQIELRIAASLAQDAHMIEVFEQGQDIHQATAAFIHGVSVDEVTPEQRSSAKEVNFGVLYGMGAYGLAARTALNQWQAQAFIDAYFEAYQGVHQWIEKTIAQAKETGYAETLFGRRRYLPELHSPNKQLQAAGERMAINMPIQGTNADMIKRAMIAFDTWIRKTYSSDDVRMLLQVHDELIIEVREPFVAEVEQQLTQIMQSVVSLAVPVRVDAHHGTSWGLLKG
jgi:DNA polymerase-1